MRIFRHEPQPPHSVLKLLRDVFASPATAAVFYHADMMVLIDITVRHVTDLSPGDKVPAGICRGDGCGGRKGGTWHGEEMRAGGCGGGGVVAVVAGAGLAGAEEAQQGLLPVLF